jgi:hypothetical protein
MSETEWASAALINDLECSRKATLFDFDRPTHRSPSATTTGMRVGCRSVLILRRKDSESCGDGVVIGMDNFAARTPHRLTCQLLWRE